MPPSSLPILEFNPGSNLFNSLHYHGMLEHSNGALMKLSLQHFIAPALVLTCLVYFNFNVYLEAMQG